MGHKRWEEIFGEDFKFVSGNFFGAAAALLCVQFYRRSDLLTCSKKFQIYGCDDSADEYTVRFIHTHQRPKPIARTILWSLLWISVALIDTDYEQLSVLYIMIEHAVRLRQILMPSADTGNKLFHPI